MEGMTMLPAVEPSLDRPGASEPRNLSGTPGHAALRSFWQSQPRKAVRPDVVTNLQRTTANVARGGAATEKKAREAHALAVAGMTATDAARAVGLKVTTVYVWWQRLNLPSPSKARQGVKHEA